MENIHVVCTHQRRHTGSLGAVPSRADNETVHRYAGLLQRVHKRVTGFMPRLQHCRYARVVPVRA